MKHSEAVTVKVRSWS